MADENAEKAAAEAAAKAEADKKAAEEQKRKLKLKSRKPYLMEPSMKNVRNGKLLKQS